MRSALFLFISFIFLGGVYSKVRGEPVNKKEEMLALAKKVSQMFDYYDEISPSAPNIYKGKSEKGGQCGDYALAFVNLWNTKKQKKAFLVIQQQGLKQFPDGIYKVIGKDAQNLPFLKNRTTSMVYEWNHVKGIGHPQLGGYKIELIKKVYVKSHFGIKNWNRNGPHIWVVIDKISIDPTYLDIGMSPVIGHDKYAYDE